MTGVTSVVCWVVQEVMVGWDEHLEKAVATAVVGSSPSTALGAAVAEG